MQNRCVQFKQRITEMINELNTLIITEIRSLKVMNTIRDTIKVIDDMYKFATNNNLIQNTENPSSIDAKLYAQLQRYISDPNIEQNEKEYLIENFKQLLIDQLNVLYIINCKPIIKDKLSEQILDKQIILNQTNRFAKENNIFTDGVPFRKIRGGNLINFSKAYYKAYRDLYLILKKN